MHKNLWILYLTLLLLTQTSIDAQWVEQNSGVSNDLFDVCFVDSINGWVIGENLIILNTRDGGLTWTMQEAPVSSGSFSKIEFIDNNVGYIVGKNGLILGTKNGGNSWVRQNSKTNFYLQDVSFIDSETGWIAGGDFELERKVGIVLHTTDGGEDWNIQYLTEANDIQNSKLFHAIKFITPNIGWTLASDYYDNFSPVFIYKTEDGGSTWNIAGEIDHFPHYVISCVSIDTLWLGGYGFSYSSNGGMTWRTIDNLPGVATDLYQISGLCGFIKAHNYSNQWIFYTEDGGLTWIDTLRTVDKRVKDFTSYKGKKFWAVGSDGYLAIWNNKITNVLDTNPLSNSISYVNIYPNPFNSTTNIEFYLIKKSKVKIELYNILGERIETMVDTEINSGKNLLSLDFTSLPINSGVFLLRIISDQHQRSIKIIYMK